MKHSSDINELKKMQRASLVKMFVIVMIVVMFAVFGSVAWFTMNREVEGAGVQMRAEGVPYVIQTRSNSGYYSAEFATLDTDAMEWLISTSDNFDNHSSAIESGENAPGLEPGDHGSLEFRVNPQNTNTITVDCVFDIKAYLETMTTNTNNNSVTEIIEINDATLVNYIKCHIMLFTNYNTTTGKYSGLIDNDQEFRRVLSERTYAKDGSDYTKIYWVWPEHLSDLTDSSNTIYDTSEYADIIDYIARNKDGFFKDCSDTEVQVRTDLTNLYSNYSNQIYNHYNIKYDNADLDIGNNINYIVLFMKVEQ